MEKEKIAKEMFDELSRIATDSGKPIERREEPLMRAVFEVTYSKVMKAINKEHTSLDINRGVTEENWRLRRKIVEIEASFPRRQIQWQNKTKRNR